MADTTRGPESTPQPLYVLAGLSGQKIRMDNMDDSIVPQLMRIRDLAEKLRLGPKALYVRLQNDPSSLPPRFRLPGTNLLLWHPKVVKGWMDQQAGLPEPTAGPPPVEKRRPGRPTKAEQIGRERKGGVK